MRDGEIDRSISYTFDTLIFARPTNDMALKCAVGFLYTYPVLRIYIYNSRSATNKRKAVTKDILYYSSEKRHLVVFLFSGSLLFFVPSKLSPPTIFSVLYISSIYRASC